MTNILFNKQSVYALRYSFVWLGLGLLWLLVQLSPYSVQLKLGSYIGLLLLRLSKREKKIAEINIGLCFPDLSVADKKELLKKNFINLGISLFETAFACFASQKRIRALHYQIEGMEHVKIALQAQKGALIFTGHFACLHLAGRLISLDEAFSAMFFPPKNPVLRLISWRSMQRVYQLAIPRDNARTLIKALKANHAVLYTPDTDAGLKNSLFAPFFNIMTATVTATARFVAISQCKIIPIAYFRDPQGQYIIRFYPALENYPRHQAEDNAVIINQWLEKFILEHPEQYLWQYKRFKTRPVGEKSFYSR